MLSAAVAAVTACSADAAHTNVSPAVNAAPANVSAARETVSSSIEIDRGSPSEVIKAFYQYLREGRYRDAIFLTNLRPAIEGLTESELKDLAIDFDKIGKNATAEVRITGEIITGDRASVTLSVPSEEAGKENEIRQVKLRKENDVWTMLAVDEADEARVKKEGRNYFYALKIDAHQEDAKQMLDRIAMAQIAFSAQNGGKFAALEQLIEAGLVPADARTAESTGYLYGVELSGDASEYKATATPAEYGKTGKLSYLVVLKGKNAPTLSSGDNGGKPLTAK